jgi:hypothetical protein
MGMLDFPDPAGMIEGVKMDGLEREIMNSAMSAMYSSWITFVWTSGSAKWADWSGEGQAMKNSATTAYITLHELEKKGFLTLTVPAELLDPANLAKFQTATQSKK